VARYEEAYTLYCKAASLINDLVKLHGVKEPSQLSAITQFVFEMDAIRANDKARGSRGSMHLISMFLLSLLSISLEGKKGNKGTEEGSDDDEVVVITKPSEDTEVRLIRTMFYVSQLIVRPF
jgi:hypothetical protein